MLIRPNTLKSDTNVFQVLHAAVCSVPKLLRLELCLPTTVVYTTVHEGAGSCVYRQNGFALEYYSTSILLFRKMYDSTGILGSDGITYRSPSSHSKRLVSPGGTWLICSIGSDLIASLSTDSV
ncbi:hypothetical protein KC19_3G148100 [Ceratodon purpureus]|uniref:Uncharacterized protein n=1 Tax=Ceratodon purpureus TaxID=3225 RepID=A0A8T0IIF7_CERPU|nr:hypothetical protein KC19_3G148100 [Ceratodon purpureus]